jgi:hypothetical protein
LFFCDCPEKIGGLGKVILSIEQKLPGPIQELPEESGASMSGGDVK